jgi:hypothetical protein
MRFSWLQQLQGTCTDMAMDCEGPDLGEKSLVLNSLKMPESSHKTKC